MPRFVILEHVLPPGQARGTHYDLMFQQGEVLWTWALPEFPHGACAPQGAVTELTAERLADHRSAYLTYEGEISGGRGTVRRVEEGEFDWLPSAGEGGELRAALRGRRLRGTLTLSRLDDQCWRVAFEPL